MAVCAISRADRLELGAAGRFLARPPSPNCRPGPGSPRPVSAIFCHFAHRRKAALRQGEEPAGGCRIP
jgi:hypothetical protein